MYGKSTVMFPKPASREKRENDTRMCGVADFEASIRDSCAGISQGDFIMYVYVSTLERVR